jgi:hypothetical protein
LNITKPNFGMNQPMRRTIQGKRDPHITYHDEKAFQEWKVGKVDFEATKRKASLSKIQASRKYLSQSQVSRLVNKSNNAGLSTKISL